MKFIKIDIDNLSEELLVKLLKFLEENKISFVVWELLSLDWDGGCKIAPFFLYLHVMIFIIIYYFDLIF